MADLYTEIIKNKKQSIQVIGGLINRKTIKRTQLNVDIDHLLKAQELLQKDLEYLIAKASEKS